MGRAGDLVAIFRAGVKQTGATQTVKIFLEGEEAGQLKQGFSDRQIGNLVVHPYQFDRYPFGQKG